MSLPGIHLPPALSPVGKRLNPLTSSLTSALIADALEQSSDAGVTLVLSKLSLLDVGVDAAEELATIGRTSPQDHSIVERLTLGNNCLSTLPTEFALLSRLRYLNLKHNNFSTFPDVLTLMPSLDTLDISHNKIKRLPSQPGQLINLQVFSFSRNKITRLPPYFSQFRKLELLRLERNPIEWPPRDVLELQGNRDSEKSMKDWIYNLKVWVEHNTASSRAQDDSGFGESLDWENSLKQEKHKAWRFPIREYDSDIAMVSRSRSFSVDSNASLSSVHDSFQDGDILPNGSQLGPSVNPLHVSIPPQDSLDSSPARSSSGYLPSPADSDKFDMNSSPLQADIPDLNPTSPTQHFRASSCAGGAHSATVAKMSGKKSLPDLRSAQWDEPTDIPQVLDGGVNFAPLNGSRADGPSHMLPTSHRRDPSSTLMSDSQMRPPFEFQTSVTDRMSIVPSMAFERNSYFHRLSSMPISIKLPQALQCLVEVARSILFVTSQVYQTIEHYANHAIDERHSSVFKKVLEPANFDMVQLIRALDQFDSLSQKAIPSPPICRCLVESCRNTLSVSGKAVRLFALQLRIAPCEDFRYSRWILLELYATTAEISVAWQSLLPHSDSLRTFLLTERKPVQISTLSTAEQPFGIVSKQEFTYPPPRLRTTDSSGSGFATIGRTHTARRHAGSFSSKDVEIGKQLPSYDIVPSLMGGVATHTPTLRTPKRQATAPPTISSFSTSPFPASPWPLSSTPPSYLNLEVHHPQSHVRGESNEGTPTSSSTSSPSFAFRLQLPSNSKQRVDNQALQAVRQAIDVAPSVWDTTEDALEEAMLSDPDIQEIIHKARETTRRLAENLRNMADNERALDVQLREDAHLFMKIVVQVSNLVKVSGVSRLTTTTLRSQMLKLTNSTEEFAKLLHISSFSSRPYSPMFTNPSPVPSIEDNRLTSSLSRTRSAQPTSTPKLSLSSPLDGPRSALPTSTFFKVPPVSRVPSSREPRSDIPDPG